MLVLRCLLIVLLGTGLSFCFSEKAIALLTDSMAKVHQNNPVSQPLEYERLLNTSHLPATIELPFQAEIRFASGRVEEISNHHFQLQPGSYIEIARPKETTALFILSPIEGFTSSLKISVWLGIFLTTPLWVFLILKFIKPGLMPLERRSIFPILFITSSLALLGLSIAYFFTLPMANHYLYHFNQQIGINHWVLSAYIDYVLTFLLGHGIAFSSASILFVALYYHWISSHQLARFRRHAIVLILAFSALLTPPDVISQVLLAIPLMFLFECAVWIGRRGEKCIELSKPYTP